MKTVNNYSEAELLDLNHEEEEQLIELQCAIDGVPMLPSLPQKPKTTKVIPDTIVYSLPVMSFDSKEAVLRIADAINAENRILLSYCPGPSYDKYVSGIDDSDITIESSSYMSRNQSEASKEERIRSDKADKDYTELKKRENII